MKNKGFIIIGILIWEYILVMIVASLGATSNGGGLIEIPLNPSFFDIIITYFQIIIGLLTFSITITDTPDILIFGVVYLPLIILFTAIVLIIKGD